MKKLASLMLLILLVFLSSSCSNGSSQQTTSQNSPARPPIGDTSSSTLLPYVQLNVDELDRFNWYKGAPSVDTNQAITHFSDYFPTDYSGDTESQFTLTGNTALTPYFSFDKYGNLDVESPLSKSAFKSLTSNSNCTILNNDPNKYYCNLLVTAASPIVHGYSQTGSLPIILYAGLREYNIAEMIRNLTVSISTTGNQSGTWDNVPMRSNPFDYDNGVFLSAGTVDPVTGQYPVYYMEISALPSDFTGGGVSVVDLHKYFYSPDESETFTFDASPLTADGSTTTCNIVLLAAVNSFANPSPQLI